MLIDDLLAIILEMSFPYVKCQGNSIKFHWPSHWVYFRLQLGCAAAEKTLERKLAETQNKNYRFTNGKGNIDCQIMKKDMKAWTLRDVLHAGGLPPMEDRTDIVDLMGPPTKQDPWLKGRTSVFQFETTGKGLPLSLPEGVRRVLLSAVKRDVANGILQWRPPITIAASMSISLRNRLAPIESKNSYARTILRATAQFHNKPMWDCVKFACCGRIRWQSKIIFW